MSNQLRVIHSQVGTRGRPVGLDSSAATAAEPKFKYKISKFAKN